jgi:hypothetical protein
VQSVWEKMNEVSKKLDALKIQVGQQTAYFPAPPVIGTPAPPPMTPGQRLVRALALGAALGAISMGLSWWLYSRIYAPAPPAAVSTGSSRP